ncbi:hypothetical protein M427DRAFT_55207 [Gonapodya prolifera JEL478]|uniref:BTB domain-containing protein n=1 Tax=Gonapodya prolifera (strain JEL478) TaxID=1344416 RepID=A0A139AK09_GONPJ|nr:hypothetical protein M427DRAFT_55207 [Gonapodya prolifera JEL478]|eukprot:KXS16884.1 hypothetical protein M427DRAFT_55207 [Gonapodya prolifera JEL478]
MHARSRSSGDGVGVVEEGDGGGSSKEEWSDFLGYLRSAQFADVVLKIRTAEGKTKLLPLHRIILSNRSPFFRHLFSTDPAEKNSKGVPVYDFPTVPAHPKLFVMLGQLLWWLYQTTDELIEHIPTSRKWDETLGLHHLAIILKLDRVLVLTNTRILSVVQSSSDASSKDLAKIADEARRWNLPEVEKLVRAHQDALKAGQWDVIRAAAIPSRGSGSGSVQDVDAASVEGGGGIAISRPGSMASASQSRAASIDAMRATDSKTSSLASTAFSSSAHLSGKQSSSSKSMALRQSEALAQQVLANVDLQKKVDELREAQAVLIARVSDLERENALLAEEKEQLEHEMAQRTRGRAGKGSGGGGGGGMLHSRASEPHLGGGSSGAASSPSTGDRPASAQYGSIQSDPRGVYVRQNTDPSGLSIGSGGTGQVGVQHYGNHSGGQAYASDQGDGGDGSGLAHRGSGRAKNPARSKSKSWGFGFLKRAISGKSLDSQAAEEHNEPRPRSVTPPPVVEYFQSPYIQASPYGPPRVSTQGLPPFPPSYGNGMNGNPQLPPATRAGQSIDTTRDRDHDGLASGASSGDDAGKMYSSSPGGPGMVGGTGSGLTPPGQQRASWFDRPPSALVGAAPAAGPGVVGQAPQAQGYAGLSGMKSPTPSEGRWAGTKGRYT